MYTHTQIYRSIWRLSFNRWSSHTQKMVFDAALFDTQHYKVWIKGKVVQSDEKELHHHLYLGVIVIEKGVFNSLATAVANVTYIYVGYIYVCVGGCMCVYICMCECACIYVSMCI